MNILKKVVVLIMILFYFLAGVNHFVNPYTYVKLIPSYLPFPETLNYIAGIFEISFAILLFPNKSRKYACWGIILMLIAFIPSHILMIQKANTSPLSLGKLTITPLIAWARIPIQGVLILWAFWSSKMQFNFI